MDDSGSLAYSLDSTHWPIVKAAATGAVRDEAALDRFYVALEALLERRTRLALMLDLRGAYSDAARRKRFAAWQERRKGDIRRYCIALAVLAPSPFQRGIVTATLWVAKPSLAVRVFATEDDGMRWLREMLAAEAERA